MFNIPKPLRFEITRLGLVQRLAQNLDDKLIALIAPSGYGKSTLLAQYARAAERPVVWVNLNDRLIGAFDAVTRFLRATAHISGLETLQDMLATAQEQPLETLTSGALSALSRLNVNVDVLFDGIETLNADGLAWLDSFIRGLGEGHRVILSGYSLAQLNLARLAARGEMLVLDIKDLSFSENEISSYLSARGAHDRHKAHEFKDLHGWAAGLALAASGVTTHLEPKDLLREAILILPHNVREHLPEAAVLEVWSEAAARELGLALPDGWLDVVIRSGLPLSPLQRGIYQPHRLLLEHLESELRLQAERFQNLMLRAAELAQTRSELTLALRLFIKAQAYPQALEVVTPLVSQYRVRGERRSIRELLELFPFEKLSNELQCRLAFNWIETGEPERGERSLNQLADSGQIHSVGLASLAVLAHRRGDYSEQLRLALEARKIQTPNELPGAVASQVIGALLGLGRLGEALTEAQGFVGWAEVHQEAGQLVTALSFLSYVLEQQHQFEAQRQTLLRTIQICQDQNFPNRAATLQIDLAKLEAMREEFGVAQELLRVARVSIEPSDGFAVAILEEACGLVADWSQETDQAREYFELGLRAAETARANVLTQRLRFHLVDLSFRLGKPQPNVELNGHYLEFIQAFKNAQGGQFETALAQLESLEQLPLEPYLIVRVLAMQADCFEHLGRDSSAVRSKFAGWNGVVGTKISELEQFENTPKNSSIQTLNSVAALEPTKPELVLTTLGEFRAQINGVRVPIHLTKSAELLAWLAIYRSGTREVIVEALWGTDAEERHYEYFRVAVRRLRVALNAAYSGLANPLPIELGRYQLASELKIQTDLPVPSEINASLEMLEAEFIRLSQPFLPESEAEWIELLRDQIRERAVDLGLRLANQQTRATEAIVRYQQVLKLDPMSDKANQGLIERHYQAGAVGAAQRALEQYERVLRQELGLTPMEGFLEQMRVWGLKPQAL